MEKAFEQLADEVNEIMNRVIPENMNCRCAVHPIPPAIADVLFALLLHHLPECICRVLLLLFRQV